jgi:murein DD-endopeptidase MepM/ murein hydrolase activator NlpD
MTHNHLKLLTSPPLQTTRMRLTDNAKVIVVGLMLVAGFMALAFPAVAHQPSTRTHLLLPTFKAPYTASSTVFWTSGPHEYGDMQLNSTYPSGLGSGLDFANGQNFEVLAMASGEIINADCDDNAGFGCQIAIRHDEGGSVLVYAHLLPGSFRVA